MSDFSIGDRVRLLPTTPNIRLHNTVGDEVGVIIGTDDFKAWAVFWTIDFSDFLEGVHEHEIEKVTDV